VIVIILETEGKESALIPLSNQPSNQETNHGDDVSPITAAALSLFSIPSASLDILNELTHQLSGT
jgi:hypothetical protein